MSGEPIQAVETGIGTLISALRRDPQALETVYISIISFNTTTDQVLALTDLPSVSAPSFSASGITEMGAALQFLADKIKQEVKQATSEQRGDWRPMVFLFTDGNATDSVSKGVEALRQIKPSIIVACGAGSDVNAKELAKITEAVVTLDNTDEASISQYFRWVTQSIAAASASVGANVGEISAVGELPPPPPEVNLQKF
jgi:uncharacterized protein YegL